MKVLEIMTKWEDMGMAALCQQLPFWISYGYLPMHGKVMVGSQEFTVGCQSWIDFIEQAEFDKICITVFGDTISACFYYWPTPCGNYLYVTRVAFLCEDEAARDEMANMLLMIQDNLPDQIFTWIQKEDERHVIMLMERPSFVDREYLLSGNAL